jgi:hypothetical protein
MAAFAAVLHNNTKHMVVRGCWMIQNVVLNDKTVTFMYCSKVNDEITYFKFWSKEFRWILHCIVLQSKMIKVKIAIFWDVMLYSLMGR